MRISLTDDTEHGKRKRRTQHRRGNRGACNRAYAGRGDFGGGGTGADGCLHATGTGCLFATRRLFATGGLCTACGLRRAATDRSHRRRTLRTSPSGTAPALSSASQACTASAGNCAAHLPGNASGAVPPRQTVTRRHRLTYRKTTPTLIGFQCRWALLFLPPYVDVVAASRQIPFE